MGDLSKHFSIHEFACGCGCGFNAPDPELLHRLELARKDAGIPFFITSGCRCEKHNKDVGGAINSAHVTGCAVDIQSHHGTHRYVLVRSLMRFFTRIGIGKNFIHVDCDETKPSPSMWVY